MIGHPSSRNLLSLSSSPGHRAASPNWITKGTSFSLMVTSLWSNCTRAPRGDKKTGQLFCWTETFWCWEKSDWKIMEASPSEVTSGGFTILEISTCRTSDNNGPYNVLGDLRNTPVKSSSSQTLDHHPMHQTESKEFWNCEKCGIFFSSCV